MKKMFTIAMVTVTALSMQALGAELIVNGSFENPDIADNSWAVFISVDGWAIEWTTTGDRGPELEVWDPTVVAGVEAYDGDQCVELDSYDPTTISQAVPTIPGVEHELTYAWRPRPGTDCAMDVLVDDVVVASHFGTTGDWQLETYVFTASSENTTVAFAETGTDDQLGMLLDAVSLVNTEPVGTDSATGCTSDTDGTGNRIKPKGAWFMYNAFPGGDDGCYPIQAGNPLDGVSIIGSYCIADNGDDTYTATYDIDDTIEINGVIYDIVVTAEHLGIGDSLNFKAKPGQDDNADFGVPFDGDDDGFYIFAHFEVEYW